MLDEGLFVSSVFVPFVNGLVEFDSREVEIVVFVLNLGISIAFLVAVEGADLAEFDKFGLASLAMVRTDCCDMLRPADDVGCRESSRASTDGEVPCPRPGSMALLPR